MSTIVLHTFDPHIEMGVIESPVPDGVEPEKHLAAVVDENVEHTHALGFVLASQVKWADDKRSAKATFRFTDDTAPQTDEFAIVEYVTTNGTNDAWLCPCGNMAHLDGFTPSKVDGTRVEPYATDGGHEDGVEGPWDEKHYVCNVCGRVIDQSSIEPNPYKTEADETTHRVLVVKEAA